MATLSPSASGPRRLLKTTSWPLASASRPKASATAPAPIVPNFMPHSCLSLSEAHSSLHLCDPTIHEQLDSRDIATVVGREEHHGPGNLVGSTETAERHRG